MNIIKSEGSGIYDFWTVDGNRAFATIPNGIIKTINGDLDICLQNGNARFGYHHINQKHRNWIKKSNFDCPAKLLHDQLGKNGLIHAAIEYTDRYSITIRMGAAAMIICDYKRVLECLTVTTMYMKQGSNHNLEQIGKYHHSFRN